MPLLVYSALRLGLFALALVGLWAVGMRDWLLVVLAAVVAWALSYVLLAGPRDAAALWLSQRVEGRSARFSPGVEADAAAEDAEAEDARARAHADDDAPAHGRVGTSPHAQPTPPDAEATPPDAHATPPDADATQPDADLTPAGGEDQSASPRPSSTP